MTYLTLRNESRPAFGRLFEDFWNLPLAAETPAWSPAAEIEEAEGHYLLSLETPGMKRDELHIEVADDQVIVSGERKAERKESGLYTERRFGRFERSFRLPVHVDTARIEASYEDGVLKVLVPKAENAKPRQVKISDGFTRAKTE